MSKSSDFRDTPAHLIRRAHQLAVAIFMEETSEYAVTPVQFSILTALLDSPGEDQVSLAAHVAFDAATSGSVVSRLEARGWIHREADARDRRRKRLWVTPDGREAVREIRRAAKRAQTRVMGPLAAEEQEALKELLTKMITRLEAPQ
jgi:DNA-binding MarR family transcriptional regulator